MNTTEMPTDLAEYADATGTCSAAIRAISGRKKMNTTKMPADLAEYADATDTHSAAIRASAGEKNEHNKNAPLISPNTQMQLVLTLRQSAQSAGEKK